MLQKGTKAPDFAGYDENGNMVRLGDFAGKRLVLYFYPKDSTPGCTAEACDLRDNYERFLAAGYEILGVSKDSQASHRKFIEKYSLPFHLISDPECTILKAYEAWGPKKFMGRETVGTLRTTYVIGGDGTIVEGGHQEPQQPDSLRAADSRMPRAGLAEDFAEGAPDSARSGLLTKWRTSHP